MRILDLIRRPIHGYSAWRHYFRGLRFLSEDPEEANREFSQAFEIKPDYFMAYFPHVMRGFDNLQKGELDQAIAEFDQSIRIKPDRGETYANRASAFAQKGDFDQAIADYDKALQFQPEDPDSVYFGRGLAYVNKGDLAQAISSFDKAIELRPTKFFSFKRLVKKQYFMNIYFERGNALLQSGEYARAIADFDNILEQQPENAEAYHKRSQCYFEIGQEEQASADYERSLAVAQTQGNVLVLYSRALIKKAQGCKEEAISDFKQIIALDVDAQLSQKAAEELQKLDAGGPSVQESATDDRE